MYWKKADGTLCGVLSDYDLSVKLDRQDGGLSPKQRMGTRPFMARDLLEPTPREHYTVTISSRSSMSSSCSFIDPRTKH
ncbi:hypothetical protein BJ912DRAFT_951081 [Pholiota molesta]|nr:hypothetical protein BJ912DRAFT_951081 [Pholiota molesta]